MTDRKIPVELAECGCPATPRDIAEIRRAARRAHGILPLARTMRSPEFIAAHPSGGTVIPVLPDDTVAYVLDRLRDAGGKATLALVTHEDVQLVELRDAGLPVTATEDPGDAPTKNKALGQDERGQG